MANIIFSRKEFEKQIKITDEIIEKISLFGTPLERIDDKEIEIEVFPNRPDLLSMQGYIRGFKSFLGKDNQNSYSLKKPLKDYGVIVKKSVKSVRPHTLCAIVKSLSFNDEKIKEIISLQEKLHNTIGRNRKKVAIGIYPLEKISLPITYEAKKPQDIKFRPLESNKELTGLQILTRHPTGKAYAHLLENESEFPVFIDANNKILSMPPIINSHDIGKITSQTKEVFVECSGFDLNTLNKTLNIITTTLSDLGGEVFQIEIIDEKKFLTPDYSTEKIKVSLENTNKLLGLNLKEKDLEKLLKKMGFEYKNKQAIVPFWRTDILHEVDLIEDIAIAYGYDNLIPEIPKVATTGEESKNSKISSKISEILVGLGLLEISSYHLIKHEEAKKFKLKDSLELIDSKTDYKILRPNLFIPTLRILSENVNVEYPQKIFEIGTTFNRNPKTETGIEESEKMIIALAPGNFTDAKQILDYFMKMLNLEYVLEKSNHSQLIEGRIGSIYINKKEIGYIGEVHPSTLRSYNLKMPMAVIEISLEEIYNSF